MSEERKWEPKCNIFPCKGCEREAEAVIVVEEWKRRDQTIQSLTAQLGEAREALGLAYAMIIGGEKLSELADGIIVRALYGTPSTALARYRAMEKVARAVQTFMAQEMDINYYDGMGHDAKLRLEEALDELEATQHGQD